MHSSLETLPRVLLSPVCSSLNYLTSLVTTFPEFQTFLPVLCSRIYSFSEIRSTLLLSNFYSFLGWVYKHTLMSSAFYLLFSYKKISLFRISYKLISRHSLKLFVRRFTSLRGSVIRRSILRSNVTYRALNAWKKFTSFLVHDKCWARSYRNCVRDHRVSPNNNRLLERLCQSSFIGPYFTALVFETALA